MTNPNPLSQFVVNQLVPEGRNEQGRAYQLTDSSVSPSRIVSIDDDGNEIEETICALAKSQKFVDRDGNICEVPLRTGRVLSMEPEATRYEDIMTHDQIRAGGMPLEACPFTLAYRHIKGGALIKPRKKGDEDCGGSPGAQKLKDACSHMQAIVAERRERALKRTLNEDAKMKALKTDDVAALMKAMVEGLGQKLDEKRSAEEVKTARANLRDNKETPVKGEVTP